MISPSKQPKQYDHKQSDYDNVPALFPGQNGAAHPTAAAPKPPRLHQYPPSSVSNGSATFDMTSGPPGYYQSLPQSSFMRHQLEKQQQQHPPLPPMPRFNTTAETISNFINGNGPFSSTNGVSGGEQSAPPTLSTFNSLPRYAALF